MLDLPLLTSSCALFLDFDGTLADIASHPQAVSVHAQVPRRLAGLAALLDGALAVVTGRPIGEIDQFLAPLQLPAAGVHGTERRGADGTWHRLQAPPLDAVLPALRAFCKAHPGLLLEEKSGAVALHYRQAPTLEAQCLDVMVLAQQQLQDMALMRGKQVVEMKPRAAGKDAAVRAFLSEVPFRGRRPWFFGDDVTDEVAFEAVQGLNGVAVKVGAGTTCARHRVDNPASVAGWMEHILQLLGNRSGTAS
jgi:trehalose 6-phosphate phosphatase